NPSPYAPLPKTWHFRPGGGVLVAGRWAWSRLALAPPAGLGLDRKEARLDARLSLRLAGKFCPRFFPAVGGADRSHASPALKGGSRARSPKHEGSLRSAAVPASLYPAVGVADGFPTSLSTPPAREADRLCNVGKTSMSDYPEGLTTWHAKGTTPP